MSFAHLGSHLVDSGWPTVSSGSFVFAAYKPERPWRRRVPSDIMCSFCRALGVVGFIPVRRIHFSMHCESSGSFGFVRVIQTYPGGRWVRLESLGSSGCTLGVVGFIHARPRCRWIHSGSLGSFVHALRVVVFIRFRWYILGRRRGG